MACELEKKELQQAHGHLDAAISARTQADQALIDAENEAERLVEEARKAGDELIETAAGNVRLAQINVEAKASDVESKTDLYIQCVTGSVL